MSTTTELAELHHLIGGLRRCVSSLKSRYADSPAMRRIVNDAERILNDVELLDIDANELALTQQTAVSSTEKIGIPPRHPPLRLRLLARRRRRGRGRHNRR